MAELEMTSPPAARTPFRAGLADLVAFMPGHFVWGAVFGAAATAAGGFSGPEAQAMSLVVWSGTAQLAIVQLVAQHHAFTLTLGAVAASSLMLSLRFVPMAIGIDRHLHGPRWRRALLMLGVVDASYAMAMRRDWSAGGMGAYVAGAWCNAYPTWQVGTLAGVLFGSLIPSGWTHSVEGVTLVIFAVLTAELCTSLRAALSALAAGALAVVAGHWLPEGVAVAASATAIAALAAATAGRPR